MTDLKPCPFCGGQAELFKGKFGFWHVKCGGRPECSVLPLTNSASTEAEAIAAWNSRAERTCEIKHVKGGAMYDVWRCSACGYEFVESVSEASIVQNYCPNCGARVVG